MRFGPACPFPLNPGAPAAAENHDAFVGQKCRDDAGREENASEGNAAEEKDGEQGKGDLGVDAVFSGPEGDAFSSGSLSHLNRSPRHLFCRAHPESFDRWFTAAESLQSGGRKGRSKVGTVAAMKMRWMLPSLLLMLALGCGDDDAVAADAGNGEDAGQTQPQDSGTDGGLDSPADIGPIALGPVNFVAIYEAGSAWEGNSEAQAMVQQVFDDFSANLGTPGGWNATIEVYFTDDNPGFAHTTFEDTFQPIDLEGQRVLVVPAWQKIVLDVDPNGPAQADGSGAEFAVHFNVAEQADNRGLLRHEMMHGLGAVGNLPWYSMSEANELGGPTPGERTSAALYDLMLVDGSGTPVLSNYADGTFEIGAPMLDGTFVEWMDGDAGLFFRGRNVDGSPEDMALMTGPGTMGALLRLNEVTVVMSASAHPTWHTIEEPDRRFFRAMRYTLPPAR